MAGSDYRRRLNILAVTNLYPSAKCPTWGVFVEQQVQGLRRLGCNVTVLFVDRREHGMKAYWGLKRRVRVELEQCRPDLLHVMYGGFMAGQITRFRWPLPVVVTFHGSDLLGESTGGLLRRGMARYGVHCSCQAARRADGIVVVGNRLKESLPEEIDPERVRVIPCGIDLQRFQPDDSTQARRQLGWPEDRFHVLFPAHRGNLVKRPWLAVAAVERLGRAGVPVDLHFLENVPNSTVALWMNASDALLLTSAHEGSPTVVKEALACGLPVVSVDVGDVAERIEGLPTCHITPPEPAQIAEALFQLWPARKRVAAQDRISGLSIERTTRALSDYYVELLEHADQMGRGWACADGNDIQQPIHPAMSSTSLVTR